MLKQLTVLSVVILVLAGALLIGCSGRDNPTVAVEPLDDNPFRAPMTFSSLQFNQVGDPATRIITVYWSSDLPPSQNQAPFPVLYLLHDFDGDGEYFGRYKLQGLMEEMYRNGEIGRMLVVTVGAENTFGGSYYRNSPSSGEYADLIAEAMTIIEDFQFNGRVYTSQVGAEARAIAGHGMGGYGAVRYAMENPDLFSSVSSMSGPLSFGADWDGQPWRERLTENAFAENGVVDSASYANMSPNDASKKFTNRLFAMSAAFSPRDLDPFDSVGTCQKCGNIFCSFMKDVTPCSLFGVVPPASYTFEFPPDPNGARGDSAAPQFPANVGVDLPVAWDAGKVFVDTIWQMWLENDATTYLQAHANVFQGIPVYIDCGVDDEFGYLYHNRDFRDALNAAGYSANTDYVYDEYSGAPGLPAGHGELIAERLRKILKFHSDRLARAPGL